MPNRATFLPIFFALSVASCIRHVADYDPMPIERLDLVLASDTIMLDTEAQKAYEQWSLISGAPADANVYRKQPYVSAFQPAVDSLLPPLDSIEDVLGRVEGIDTLKLFGIIIPFNQSVVTAPDGVVYIGLNHYLGADFAGYGNAIPQFLRHRKDVRMMATDVVHAALAQKYPAQYAPLPSFLHRLMYEGALLAATQKALDAPLDVVLGFTAEQLDDVKENESRMWQALVDRGLLYSTVEADANRLLRPSPASSLISADAPGQAVLLSAVHIVESYCKAQKITPEEFLHRQLYNQNQTLIDSKYAPVRK